MMVFHDAAWANAQPDPDGPDPVEAEEAQGQGIYSQLGHLLLMTTRDAVEGKESPSLIVGWRSQACRRVCRSTFAAERMAALGGWEDALAFQAYVAGVLRSGTATTQESTSRELFPIVSVTDCKSLCHNVHRVGGPRAPTEKRLLVDFFRLATHGQ